MRRIPSTAAWSAAILSPRPTQRAAAIAADSVTRTSSSARLRSGRLGEGGTVDCSATEAIAENPRARLRGSPSMDLHALPPDLPVPHDDGAAAHLTGARMPPLA